MRSGLVSDIGCLDERFNSGPLYDDDYCKRICDAGHRILIAGDVFVYRANETALPHTDDPDSDLPFLEQKNREYFLHKWIPQSESRAQTMKNPLVSVIMATKDGETTIPIAIRSVLAQTYENFELIVVNDGGREIRPIIDKFDDPRIKYMRLEENRGKSYAYNYAIDRAGGEVIAYLDDDDRWNADHLEVTVRELVKFESRMLVYTDYIQIDCKVNQSGVQVPIKKEMKRLKNARYDPVDQGNFIPNFAIVHKKSLFDIERYDERLDFLEDWDAIRRFSKHAYFIHVSKATGEYWINVQGATRNFSILVDKNESATYKYITAKYCITRNQVLLDLYNADNLAGSSEWAAASNIYKNILETDPEYIPALEGHAKCLYNLQQYHKCSKILDQAISCDRNNYAMYVLQGNVLMSHNDFTKAKTWLEFALIVNNDAAALNLLQICYKNLDKKNTSELIKAQIQKKQTEDACAPDQQPPLGESEGDKAELGRLLKIYHTKRPDLQKAFPEVKNRNYVRLLEWVISDDPTDSHKVELRKYKNYYELLLYSLRLSEKNSSLTAKLQEAEASLPDSLKTIQEKDAFIAEIQGDKAELGRQVDALEGDKAELGRQVDALEGDKAELGRQVDALQKELESTKSGFGFRVTMYCGSKIDKLKEARNTASASRRVIRSEGIGAFMHHIREKIRRREFTVAASEIRPSDAEPTRVSDVQDECDSFRYRPRISVLMPTYNTKVAWLDLAISSLRNQAYQDWELCIADDASSHKTKNRIRFWSDRDPRIKVVWSDAHQGISGATNSALGIATGEYVLLLDHDDELGGNAMYEIVKSLNADRTIDMIYSDEDKIDRQGNFVEPFYKPDFSYHLLLSMNYLPHACVMRKSVLDQVGGFDSAYDGAQDYDLFLRIIEKTRRVHHIPKVLYHWRKSPGSGAENALAKDHIYERGNAALQSHLRRMGTDAKSSIGRGHGLYRIDYRISGTPSVDILIPTRQISFLKKCVGSIIEKSTWKNYRLWALVNGKTDYATVRIHDSSCSELMPITGKDGLIGPDLPYNWSRMNNIGAKHTSAPYIVFLNDDTEIISPDWIEQMLQLCQLDNVGVVGSMLIYPNNILQHAGDYITPNVTGDHCFNGMRPDSFEVNGLAQVVRETSAVTSACYMVPREVFERLDGYDESLRNYDDYDFCLRLNESGLVVLYTPYARSYHHESPTRPQINDKSMLSRLKQNHPWATRDRFFRYEWKDMYGRLSK